MYVSIYQVRKRESEINFSRKMEFLTSLRNLNQGSPIETGCRRKRIENESIEQNRKCLKVDSTGKKRLMLFNSELRIQA